MGQGDLFQRNVVCDYLFTKDRIFAYLTLDDLEALRQSPRDGRQYTTAWALAHALEHTGIHVGHVQIIRQWWEQR